MWSLNRRTMLLGATALAACAPTMSAQTPPQAPSSFAARVEDWTRRILREQPETGTALALPQEIMGGPYNNRLDDRSPGAARAARENARAFLAELNAIERAPLSSADQVTYDVLKAQFENVAANAQFSYGNIGQLGGPNPYVLSHQAAAFVNLPDFFDSQHAIVSSDDAEAYVARLDQVADALDQERARAEQDAAAGVIPPGFLIDKTLAALDTALATPAEEQTYLTAFNRKLAAVTLPAELGGRLSSRAEAIVRDEIMPAHARTRDFYRGLRARAADAAGIGARPQGADYYRAALGYYTTTTLAPEEIHQIGLARVAEIEARANEALRLEGLTRYSVGARLRAYTNDPARRYSNDDAGRARILADTNARIQQIIELAPQYFNRLPRAPIEVRRMPPVVEATQSAAYYQSPALDGSRPGVYYMTLRDMNTVSRVDLATVTYHEAVPGHHFQIALAQEFETLPLIRRILYISAYGEGWALYAEQLANEMGMYANDREGLIGHYRWALWRGVRLVVDSGVHALG
ncbi:MAG: DUF885 family protein, partial [Hyphomonadaceae bacterium]